MSDKAPNKKSPNPRKPKPTHRAAEEVEENLEENLEVAAPAPLPEEPFPEENPNQLKRGEIQAAPSLSATIEEKVSVAKKSVSEVGTTLQKRLKVVKSKQRVIIEYSLIGAALVTAAILFFREPENPKPKIKLEEIMAMANKPDRFKRIALEFKERQGEAPTTEAQSRIVLDTINSGNPDTRWILIGLPKNKGMSLLETRNADLMRLLDQNQLRVGTKVEVEFDPIEKADEEKWQRLVDTAQSRKAIPGLLRRITVNR